MTSWLFNYQDKTGQTKTGCVSVATRRELDSKIMAVYGDVIDWDGYGVTNIREGVPIVEKRTPWDIAVAWYTEADIERSIAAMFNQYSEKKMPTNVRSREFAEWLTHEYRLAMAKGIQLGRDGSEDALLKR